MNPKISIVALFAFLYVGCNQNTELTIVSESFTENELAMCNGTKCPEVTINYVEILGDEKVSEKINSKIKNFIFTSLLLGEDSIPTAQTIPEAVTRFIETYRADKAEFPDMAATYFAEISVNEIYSSEDLLCFEMRQYLFAGGAHGYGSTSFLNVDPDTGEELSTNDLFKDKDKFTAFAERKFRAQQHIPKEGSINESGFWFEDDVFRLPASVGFISDSLIFVYNQYDIASYAEGPIELKIAREEAEPFLRIK